MPDGRFADLGNPGWYRAGSDPPRLDESLDQPCREAPARRDSANRSCSGTSSYQYLAAVLPPPPNPRFQSEFAPLDLNARRPFRRGRRLAKRLAKEYPNA